MGFFFDALVFSPGDVDLSRSPLAGSLNAQTRVLGAFNPGLTRLANGNLLLMVRVAETLQHPACDDYFRTIRWTADGYVVDKWPKNDVDSSDPRTLAIRQGGGAALALTSLSWLLPVELDAAGTRVTCVHYNCAIAPSASYQCYGIEDPRISRVGDRWLMTACAVSPERQGTVLYTSRDGLNWQLEGLILDHQNKDMLIFEGLIGEHYWAETRPLGDAWFAYPPESAWRAGPSINFATSPDAMHWKPCEHPGIRPVSINPMIARLGGGAPPIVTKRGWLNLWHGVEPNGDIGIYRTYWSILDRERPWQVIDAGHAPLLEPAPALTAVLGEALYLNNIVFTTGIADAGDHYVVASGEADLACRVTHIAKHVFTSAR